ncbi:MAG: hypothetical protein A2Z86_05620 [Candidatus Glassbacteria bacterium GWA2_58_10]|uniref:Uncharacterized protein n=1 Tax=Candidatus Glassbacteria bacterium GWA2_58_10 TaxID=1817865 RepID=A0A1F5YEB5_9BACT|nr:MAG: hypothetical protein A2Z86_05620 [Candidatus Glassbacteria bacterium GWA2_58_10]
MSLFEENEEILEELEGVEHRLEKVKLEGADSAPPEEKEAIALEIKRCITRLAANVEASQGDVQALGGAVVLADLLEVLKRYSDIFRIPQLDLQLASLEEMWEKSR